MADLATLKNRLTTAEDALHGLLIGQQAASVNFGRGHVVTYTQANITELRRYISDLRAQIAALEGARPTRGPIRFRF